MVAPPVLGEPLALEARNTRVASDGDVVDLLASPALVQQWVAAHANVLPAGASDAPPDDAALRELRDAVTRLTDASMDGHAPDADSLAVVNNRASAPQPAPALVWPAGDAPHITHVASGDPATETLAAVARSTIAVVGDAETRTRLRRCDGPDCVLVFVATNHRRRWCSPRLCGNRVRVARHDRRQRAQGRHHRR